MADQTLRLACVKCARVVHVDAKDTEEFGLEVTSADWFKASFLPCPFCKMQRGGDYPLELRPEAPAVTRELMSADEANAYVSSPGFHGDFMRAAKAVVEATAGIAGPAIAGGALSIAAANAAMNGCDRESFLLSAANYFDASMETVRSVLEAMPSPDSERH